ncbi:MAG: lipid A biosynthesis acyltransferase [Nitrospira bacterium HGW-Nitrospira-1]|nr:MAG: lipid A biosynthesis acyltransferase [Nitrospira bacterium HGW-Nitrospira-1]
MTDVFKKIRWLLEFIFVLCLAFPIAVFPNKISLFIGKQLGSLLYLFWNSRKKIAIENIKKSIDSKNLSSSLSPETIAKECFINIGKSFAEIMRIYFRADSKIIDSLEIRGLENFNKAKSNGKGIIILTGHCGNWELMALAFGVRVHVVSGVARVQNNPYLHTLISKIRLKYGNNIIYKKGALKRILSALKGNGVVGILMDQAVSKGEGKVIDFLGRGAWTTKMPALIARKSGASILPVFIHREFDSHVIIINPEVQLSDESDSEKAVIEDTKKFTAYIEDCIRRHPSEWLWIHKRWKRVN